MKFKLKKIFSYFFQGLLYLAPIGISIYIFYSLLKMIDDIIPIFITQNIPGVGILIILVFVTLVGYVGKTFINKSIASYFDGFLEKVPLFKLIYSSIKDLLSAFVGNKKKFKHPVLVKISKIYELEKIGFLTENDLSNIGIDGTKVAVYFPHSYAFSGELFIVAAEYVKPLDISSGEAMKFIVSAGITKINNNNKKDEL